jgi:hypothetical protein
MSTGSRRIWPRAQVYPFRAQERERTGTPSSATLMLPANYHARHATYIVAAYLASAAR